MSFLKQLQQQTKSKVISNESIDNSSKGDWLAYFKKYQAKYKFKLPKDVVDYFTKTDNPKVIILDNDGKRVEDKDTYVFNLSCKSSILTPKEIIDNDENLDTVKSNFKNLNPKEIKGFPITAGWLPIVEFDDNEWPVVIDLDPSTKGKIGQVISVRFPEGLLEVKLLAKSWSEYLSAYANESFDEYGLGINENQNNSIVTDIDETDKVKEFDHHILDEEQDDEANVYVSEVKDTSSAKEGDVVQHRGDSLKEFSNESLLDKLIKISSKKKVSLEDEENKQDDTDETETTEDVPTESDSETDSETNEEKETDEGLSSGTEDSGDGSEETGGETDDNTEGEDPASEDETESEEIPEEREEEVELDKPDEEKVLIKDYLEPLLGEDVNKVKLFTAEEVNRPLYHVSMNANIKSFTPQVSKRVLSKENRSIPRISTSTSLVGCLNGYQSLVSDMDGREAKKFSGVFTVYNLPYQYAVKPDAKLLSDVELSDEYWLISWKKETFMTVPEVTATFTVPKIEKVYGNDGIDQTLHIYVKVRNGVLYIDHQRKLDVGCYHVKLEGYNFRYPLKNNNLIKVDQISENDYNRVTSLSMMIKTR